MNSPTSSYQKFLLESRLRSIFSSFHFLNTEQECQPFSSSALPNINLGQPSFKSLSASLQMRESEQVINLPLPHYHQMPLLAGGHLSSLSLFPFQTTVALKHGLSCAEILFCYVSLCPLALFSLPGVSLGSISSPSAEVLRPFCC